eukprot:scaffold6441_cov115-Skeletonema_dohrnii-CCMP3373.AAC.3
MMKALTYERTPILSWNSSQFNIMKLISHERRDRKREESDTDTKHNAWRRAQTSGDDNNLPAILHSRRKRKEETSV